jgi:hypothetical protein
MNTMPLDLKRKYAERFLKILDESEEFLDSDFNTELGDYNLQQLNKFAYHLYNDLAIKIRFEEIELILNAKKGKVKQ